MTRRRCCHRLRVHQQTVRHRRIRKGDWLCAHHSQNMSNHVQSARTRFAQTRPCKKPQEHGCRSLPSWMVRQHLRNTQGDLRFGHCSSQLKPPEELMQHGICFTKFLWLELAVSRRRWLTSWYVINLSITSKLLVMNPPVREFKGFSCSLTFGRISIGIVCNRSD